MDEQAFRQHIANERLLGRLVVTHTVNTALAMPYGLYLMPDGVVVQLTQKSPQIATDAAPEASQSCAAR